TSSVSTRRSTRARSVLSRPATPRRPAPTASRSRLTSSASLRRATSASPWWAASRISSSVAPTAAPPRASRRSCRYGWRRHSRSLLVSKQQAEPFVLLDDHFELPHARAVVDDDLIVHLHRQFDHTPEVLRRTREHREAASSRAIEAAPDQLLESLQIRRDRRIV